MRTDGPDGALHDYEIKYTFGYRPLQQYLVEFPGGRLQCLPIAWDSRPKAQGGQRWFHLYPDERITHADPLHWTGPNQNWNYMCADCHSTNLRRNYDLATNTLQDDLVRDQRVVRDLPRPGLGARRVGRGPEEAGPDGARRDARWGSLVQGLRALDYSGFGVGDATSAAARLADRPRQRAEIQACAPCHARRGPITDVPDHGKTFLDSYRPALLDDGLYYADGQIREEVYEYASFTQSKMYAAGVTCSDCHNAHSLKQRGTGQQRVRALPPAADLRHAGASPPQAGHRRGALPQLPHADDDLHGGGPALRPLDARAARGLLDRVRHPERLHDALPPGQERHVGERRRREVVRADAHARQRLRRGVRRRAQGLPDAERLLRAVVLDASSRHRPGHRARAPRGLLSPASIDALHAGLTDATPSCAPRRRGPSRAAAADRLRLGRPLLTDPVRLVRASAAVSLAGRRRTC